MLKLVISAALLVCVSADVSHVLRTARLSPGAVAALVGVPPAPYPTPAARQIAILRQSQDIQPDGSYQWAYETENGIAAQEEGRPVQVSPQEVAENVQGSFRYTAPDGTPVDISYIANENGFQPQGSVLPTPPPVPLAIQRSLEFNERNAPSP